MCLRRLFKSITLCVCVRVILIVILRIKRKKAEGVVDGWGCLCKWVVMEEMDELGRCIRVIFRPKMHVWIYILQRGAMRIKS